MLTPSLPNLARALIHELQVREQFSDYEERRLRELLVVLDLFLENIRKSERLTAAGV